MMDWYTEDHGRQTSLTGSSSYGFLTVMPNSRDATRDSEKFTETGSRVYFEMTGHSSSTSKTDTVFKGATKRELIEHIQKCLDVLELLQSNEEEQP